MIDQNTSTTIRRAGRPPLVKDGQRITAVLPAEGIEFAKIHGDGNVSEGLRRILALTMAAFEEQEQDAATPPAVTVT